MVVWREREVGEGERAVRVSEWWRVDRAMLMVVRMVYKGVDGRDV